MMMVMDDDVALATLLMDGCSDLRCHPAMMIWGKVRMVRVMFSDDDVHDAKKVVAL